ncbi:hypothetical protein [Bradyrhizobium lablabi]|uniref:hypothetical protein n=1 Tax=Bradyrhizobium lablabi TaxID=722472 RepID=UPI001BA55DF8|nr:hypothetical protein [Bradyrhizobium lablabi]MBR0697367.1 hypothetical protein [Bradyrhizobium lablabi]
MPVIFASLRAALAARGLVLTMQPAIARHPARERYHSDSAVRSRAWEVYAAASQPADRWWTRLVDATQSAFVGR